MVCYLQKSDVFQPFQIHENEGTVKLLVWYKSKYFMYDKKLFQSNRCRNVQSIWLFIVSITKEKTSRKKILLSYVNLFYFIGINVKMALVKLTS